MSAEENRTITRRFFEQTIGKGNLTLLDELCAPGFVNHGYGTFVGPVNREETKKIFATLRAGFPDLSITIADMFSDGDHVVSRLTVTGTHTGPFLGLAPTGKSFEVPGTIIFRFDGGKIVEAWPLIDQLAMMRQLGALPAVEQAREVGG